MSEHNDSLRSEYASPDWLVPSIVLIEQDASVLVPVRALAMLVSYALAGPSSDATTRSRDEAVAAAHAAIVAHWTEHKAETGADR